jgi:hypothetical protein
MADFAGNIHRKRKTELEATFSTGAFDGVETGDERAEGGEARSVSVWEQEDI